MLPRRPCRSGPALVATSLLTGLVANAPAEGTLQTRTLFSETANLTYQLDVVGEVLGFTDPADYRALWNREFLRSDADRQMLARWTAVKRRYDTSFEISGPTMPLGVGTPGVSIANGIRIAGLRAENDAAFLQGASLLMLPADAAVLGDVLRHFSPRFHVWWGREPARAGRGFVREMERSLASPKIRERIESFRRLYAPALPLDAAVTFSLLYRPDLVKASSSGQQLGSVGAVEFVRGEHVADRLDVVLHEFCHFLYDSRPIEATAALQRRFLESGDPGAKPAYNLLNEGMAAALGNGIIGRENTTPERWRKRLTTPLSFYNNLNIDRTGKRILTMMDDWLPTGRSLDDPAFVGAYLKALRDEFGPELTSPRLFLGEAYLYVDGRFGRPFLREFRRRLGVTSAYSQVDDALTERSVSEYKGLPGLSAVFVIPTGQIAALVLSGVVTEAQAAAIQGEAATHGSALYSFARSSFAHTFVIVTDDAEEAKRRAAQLAEAREMFSGLAPFLPR